MIQRMQVSICYKYISILWPISSKIISTYFDETNIQREHWLLYDLHIEEKNKTVNILKKKSDLLSLFKFDPKGQIIDNINFV